jgi:tRNA A-37 threonylcarbamoyl transferase component Bud32
MENYAIVRELGRGNYGKISLVQDARDGRMYVCKRITLTGKTPQQRQTAENEVRAMAQLDHPNIVGFQQAFVQGDVLHILMEFVDGVDVEKLLVQCLQAKRMLTEQQILDIFVPTCLAVRHIHRTRLLHRDLKSANIFLTSTGDVRIGDFGFAKQLTMTTGLASTVCGTPYYFSPEMCQKQPYNNKSDVWALGVVLYEMTNLRKPFEAQNLPELKRRVLTEEPAPFVATHASAELKDLCMALLRKVNAERPSIDAVLQFPIVRRHLQAMSAAVERRRADASRRSDDICRAHSSSATTPATAAAGTAASPSQQPGSPVGAAPPAATAAAQPQRAAGALPVGAEFAKMSRADVAALLKTGRPSAQLAAAGVPPPPPQATELHARKAPEVAGLIGTGHSSAVLGALASAVDEERRCVTLKRDVDALLTAPVPDAEEVFEAIGEAQSDDEKALRGELGDAPFVRAVELLLTLAIAAPEQRAALEAEVAALLGGKAHLLEKLQTVSMQFGLDAA